jgi:FkbM family methyltransferase
MSQYKLSATCQISRLADLYEVFLGFKTNGSFVEVGAFDGDYVSNTSGLADIGWRGIYIEPVTQFAQKCAARHAHNAGIEVLHCAAGEDEREIQINIGGPLSTINPTMVEKFNNLPWAQGYHQGIVESIKQYPLDIILRSRNFQKSFDVLSIDVEGYEWNVLSTFPIQQWKPKIVIIELHDTNPEYKEEWASNNLVSEYMRCNRYDIIYKDFSNTVYKFHDVSQSTL